VKDILGALLLTEPTIICGDGLTYRVLVQHLELN